ncbi:MAG: hypothetical protein ABIJ34_01095 [archaeon]
MSSMLDLATTLDILLPTVEVPCKLETISIIKEPDQYMILGKDVYEVKSSGGKLLGKGVVVPVYHLFVMDISRFGNALQINSNLNQDMEAAYGLVMPPYGQVDIQEISPRYGQLLRELRKDGKIPLDFAHRFMVLDDARPDVRIQTLEYFQRQIQKYKSTSIGFSEEKFYLNFADEYKVMEAIDAINREQEIHDGNVIREENLLSVVFSVQNATKEYYRIMSPQGFGSYSLITGIWNPLNRELIDIVRKDIGV